MSNNHDRNFFNAQNQILTHAEIEALLAAYTAGELKTPARAVAEQHLAQCGACQQALAQTQHIRRLLKSLTIASSTPDYMMAEAGRETTSIANVVLAELAEPGRTKGNPAQSAMSHIPMHGRRSLQHRLGMIAAVFFLTLLVGSMIVVLNVAHSDKNHTVHPGIPTLPPFPTIHTATSSTLYAVIGNTLNEIDARTGKILWSKDMGQQPDLRNLSSIGTPVVANGVIYITATSGHTSPITPYMLAFRASDGSLMWHTQVYSNAELQEFKGISYGDLGFTADPTVANGMVYTLSRTGKVYALDAANGKQRWEYDTHLTAFVNGGTNSGIWDSSSVVVDNGVVYGTMLNQVYAINATTGTGLWSVPVNNGQIITNQLAISNGAVYGASFDLSKASSQPSGYAYVYAFNAKTGVRIWTSNKMAVALFTAPTVANGIVYLGSIEDKGGAIYAFHASDGTLLWSKSLETGKMKMPEGGVYNPLIIIDGVLYLQDTVSDNGAKLQIGQTVPGVSILYALDASNGLVYWQRTFHNPYPSLAFLLNGVIFAPDDNNTIRTFSLYDGHEIWHHKYGGLLGVAP